MVLALGGCAGGDATPGTAPRSTADRVLFLAATGEAPGDVTPYVDVTGRHRLGRRAPPAGVPHQRPAVTPTEKAGPGVAGKRLDQLRDLYAAVRQRLSDRDDEVQFRQRSLSLHVGRWGAALGKFDLKPGDPLPANDQAFRTNMTAAREAAAAIRGELSRLHGVILRLEGNLRAALVIEAGVRAAAGLSGETAADRTLRAALLKATSASVKSARTLRRLVGDVLAKFVEWLSGQEQSLDHLERQVVARGARPAGPRTIMEMIDRKTLIK